MRLNGRFGMIRLRMVRHFFLFIAFLMTGLASGVEAQETSLFPIGTGRNLEFRKGLEQETFLLVNDYRKKNKLPMLSWSSAIAQVAREHSKDMATGKVDFGHDGFNGRVNRLKTTLIRLNGCGENVLKTDDPNEIARKAVELWLRSPAHLHNIRGDYNCSGMGIWEDKDGMIYFTQIFAKVGPKIESAQTAPDPQVTTPFGLLAPPNPRTQP